MTWKVVALATALMTVPLLAMAKASPYAGLELAQTQGSVTLYDVLGVRNHFSNSGTDGGVFFGVGTEFIRHLWLALEVNGDFSSDRTPTQAINISGGTSTGRLRTRYTYGVNLLPGIRFSRFMVFGRGGVLQSSFEFRQPSPPAGSNGITDQTLARGSIYGGGLQIRITDMFHLRGEYDRVVYYHFSSFNNRISVVDRQIRLGFLLDLA